MFRDYCFNVKLRRVFAAFISFSLVVPTISYSAEASEVCAAAIPLHLDATIRGHGREDEKTSYYHLEVADPGIVSLEISVPGASEVLPRLDLFTDDCESPGIGSGNITVVEQSATHLILAVAAPGAYYFRSGAQDPRQSLPDFKLTASYYKSPTPREIPARLATKEEPVAVDPDPDSEASAEEPVAVDPDPDSEASAEEPVAVDPDPDSLTGGATIGQLLTGLCRAARSDDHGDTSTCATLVVTGGSAAGELANGWGDDYDFFTFTLTELETVAVGTSGTTDTFGALFDSSGHMLATDDDGGDGSNFLIVRTLSPGRYFVRVEGALSTEGPYELGLAPSGW